MVTRTPTPMADVPVQIIEARLRVQGDGSPCWTYGWMAMIALLSAGCPRPTTRPLDPMPIDETIRAVNDNLPGAQAGLKARGRVTVDVTDASGARHRRFLDGTLLIIPPRHVRFDMTVLGKTQILLGSNADAFWFYLRQDEGTLRWGHHDRARHSQPAGMPIRPDMIIEALGLSRLDRETAGPRGPVQRIEPQYQQLLYLDHDEVGQGYIEKEYWIERVPDGRPRRILFRDPIGQVVMQSQLDDYRPIRTGGPQLPTAVTIQWPLERGGLTFHVRGWEFEPRLTSEAAAFVLPHRLGIEYPTVICVDEGPEQP